METIDIRQHNRDAWDAEVRRSSPWTRPVSSQQVEDARRGKWEIDLTPSKYVPKDWFPELKGCRVLCLASGGGQQGPILAAAGADVTVYDNSPCQLEQDLMVARRDGLNLRVVEGDMRDLSAFADESFDLIVHPVSNTFVPDVLPVWREAYRVLTHGGYLLSGFDNPVIQTLDEDAYMRGDLRIVRALPCSEIESLSEEALALRREKQIPLEFGHTLEELIGGQIAAGFAIVGFYEDRYPPEENDPLGKYMDSFMATRAYKALHG